MNRYHMLTLSIAEGKPGSEKFEINCVNIGKKLQGKIVSFEKTKSEIFDSYGKPIWDLGKVTAVEKFDPCEKKERNQIYMTVGEVKLLENIVITKEMLKNVLDANLVAYSKFMEDSSMIYAVVKPRRVITIDEDISRNTHYPKQRMTLDFDNDHRCEEWLNKDYRWAHYWRRIPDNSIHIKQDMYEKLFNNPNMDLYLIVRKYYFSGNKTIRYWITGMHWL